MRTPAAEKDTLRTLMPGWVGELGIPVLVVRVPVLRRRRTGPRGPRRTRTPSAVRRRLQCVGPPPVHRARRGHHRLRRHRRPGISFTFERLAVTEAQVTELGLPTAPVKATDRRSFAGASTTQAEALSPAALTGIVHTTISRHRDPDVLDAVLAHEHAERQALLRHLEHGPH